MKTSQRIACLVCIVFLATAGRGLQAQTASTQFGGQLSFANDANFGIGARVTGDFSSLVPSVQNVSVIGSFDFFFPGSSITYWELNGNAVYRIHITGARIMPYAGGGLDIAHASSGFGVGGTRLGLNLVGGTTFETSTSIRPFVELRVELAGGEQFVVSAGILF